MTQFSYRAKRGPSDVVEGVVEASSQDEAVEQLSRLGLLPLTIQPRVDSAVSEIAKTRRAPGVFVRVPFKEITLFSRQLASLIKSGIPILKALHIISEQTQVHAFRDVLRKIADSVQRGESFSQSLEAWPSLFSPFYVAMVKAGEGSGTLQEALTRVAVYRQKQQETSAKIKMAMAYPILMAVVGVATVVFMFIFVLPKLSGIFVTLGQELPWPTRVVIAISLFLREKWYVLVAILIVAPAVLLRAIPVKTRRRMTSAVLLSVPVVKELVFKSEVSAFCRTLEILIGSGIPILSAIRVSAPVLGNELIKDEILRSAVDLEQGSGFGSSLKKSILFSPYVISLISVGEESGKLEDALGEIATTYEEDCDSAVKVATSLLEPLMILGMGLVIGFIVMAMLLPVFEINIMAK